MRAAEAKKTAERALEYMRERRGEPWECFGYAWATLAQIAGKGDLPLPDMKEAILAKVRR